MPRLPADAFFAQAGGPLYRDVRGRPVVLDVEGAGEYRSQGATAIEVDGAPGPPAGRFTEWVCIAGDAEGEAWRGMPDGPAVEVVLPFEGSGWTETPARRDGMADPSAGPFFLRLEGEGVAQVRSPGPPAPIVDRFAVADPQDRKARRYAARNESEPVVLDTGPAFVSLLNRAEWEFALPSGVRHLRIGKRWDRFHGRQRARVLIDGTPVGVWYLPVENRGQRIDWAWFGVVLQADAEARQIRLGIDPFAGTALWSMSEIAVLAWP